ncbi:1-acyl-sn-glycerol-3-phosphate acyltransferase [Alphaproteobacteria bacterium]|nr:1-acyl-sn-glycerol-3-phosphate acyltransferase [Alphaproteobacteria bacterium]
MIVVRSFFYQLLFHLWTSFVAIVGLPALMLPKQVVWAMSPFWSVVSFAILRLTTGISYRLEGTENIAAGPVIYASKHQSAWDTMIYPHILKNPIVVLKKELRSVPFYGWYLTKYGSIGVNRSGGARALRAMVQEARSAIDAGRPIVVFPEGTRTAPGERGTYQSGVAALYRELGVPLVPVALNSGLFWPRRSFIRKPGTIVLRLLPAIPPGLERKAFMARLESDIEKAQAELVGNQVEN